MTIELDATKREIAPGRAARPQGIVGSPARGAPGARPLYLAGPRDATVDAEGPGLVVSAKSRALRRYPFARVSRVVSNRHMQWKARAIQACLEQGIPIVWVDGAGVAVGYLQPRLRVPSRLHDVLQELLSRPDWRQHFDAWLRSERMRAVREWRIARQSSGQVVEERAWAELVRQHVYGDPAESRVSGPEGNICRSALMALTAQYVLRCGARHGYVADDGEELDVVDELTTLLEVALVLGWLHLTQRLDACPDEEGITTPRLPLHR
jgi:hypothetical protein